MEERIKRTVIYLKALYIVAWVLPLLVGIAGEAGVSWTGLYAGDVRTTYGVETLVILLTVVCVPVSLKLFAWVVARKIDRTGIDGALRLYAGWSAVRVLMLLVPALAGFLGYVLVLSNNCLLCGFIALVAMLFCVPGQNRLRRELHIEEEEQQP